MDRLQTFQIITSSVCILCGSHVETHDHLFFACSFSAPVWTAISGRTLIAWPSLSWQPLLQWASFQFRKRKDFMHILARLSLSATVYFIWYERNNRVFSQHFRSQQDVVEEIFGLIRLRLLDMAARFQISSEIKSAWQL